MSFQVEAEAEDEVGERGLSPRLGGPSPLVVKPSSIHSRGVFANAPFRKGDVVVRWENTKELSQAEYDSLPDTERSFIDIQDGKVLLVGEPERYVNHSCEPNTQPGVLCDIAIRDIEAGEEVTADYGRYFIPSGHFECNCGKASCRGLITGPARK